MQRKNLSLLVIYTVLFLLSSGSARNWFHRDENWSGQENSENCLIYLYGTVWGKSVWGKYGVFDANYDKIQPSLVYWGPSKYATNTSIYAVPFDSIVIGKCNEMYLNLDGTNSFTSTCTHGQWIPPLKFCFDCSKSQCKITCDRPSTDDRQFVKFYDENNNQLMDLLVGAPLRSKIVTSCKDGYSRTNGTDMSTSTCMLHRSGSGWQPPIENCYRICDPLVASLGLTLDSCTLWGREVNCNNRLVAGTSAIASCHKGFSEQKHVRCEEDGKWTNLPVCVQDEDEHFPNHQNECYLPLWDSYSGTYAVHNANHDIIHPLLVYQNGNLSTYVVPANNTLVTKCNENYFHTDGTSTHMSICSGGSWLPPLSWCYDCANFKCKTSCDLLTDGFHRYVVYDERGKEVKNLTTEAPLRSRMLESCIKGYSRLNGLNSWASSKCLLYGWQPQPEDCLKICDPVPASLHVSFDQCSHWGNKVNCGGTLVAGSSATAFCQKGYHDEKFEPWEYAHCEKDGKWRNLPVCVKDYKEIGPIYERANYDAYVVPTFNYFQTVRLAHYNLLMWSSPVTNLCPLIHGYNRCPWFL